MEQFIHYEDWQPQDHNLVIVRYAANEIIEDYRTDNYTLTLRQLYYQFVSRRILPNTERSYKNLGSIISNARRAGMISWTAIHDPNRTLITYTFEEDAGNLIKNLQHALLFDQWKRQEVYLEVWVQKDALTNVVGRACRRWNVPYMACKGYLSSSHSWRAGQRFKAASERGQHSILIYLGDHDPEGLDMQNDHDKRLSLFSDGASFEVRRIALNRDQIDQYTPPPNYAKVSSTRYREYTKNMVLNVELDALEPSVIDNLLDTAIREYIDMYVWSSVSEQQNTEWQMLEKLKDYLPQVK